MLFNDLIAVLKNVKSEKDLTPKVLDELLHHATSATTDFIHMEQPEASRAEAIEVARMTALKHFDMLMVEAIIGEELDPDQPE